MVCATAAHKTRRLRTRTQHGNRLQQPATINRTGVMGRHPHLTPARCAGSLRGLKLIFSFVAVVAA
jgi:hypothetical protein